MSDIESTNWSETAANNNAAVPNGAPEGWAPSSVNDWGREVMAAVKREWSRSHATVTSGGSPNAQTLSYGVNPAALAQGQTYSFIAGFTNTAAMTLQVGSLPAKAVQLGGSALTGGEIVAGQPAMLLYDGTTYQILALPGHLRGGLVGVQVFAVPGTYTYTPTAGTNSVVVEVQGDGGGSGGTPVTGVGQASMGGPGGGGAYAKGRLTGGFSGATIVVGPGGSAASAGANPGGAGSGSAFGSIAAGGGGGGSAGSVVSSFPSLTGASGGGIASGGNIMSVNGGRGGSGFVLSATVMLSGEPGNSSLTTGLEGKTSSGAGSAGQIYGGGALPAVAGASTAAQVGGLGGAGIVIVWEFG